jgi:hypothetical protein
VVLLTHGTEDIFTNDVDIDIPLFSSAAIVASNNPIC